MGAATFKVDLKHEPNSKGLRSVRIRIIRDRKIAYLNMGIALKVTDNPRTSEWNEEADPFKANWVRHHPLSDTYNQQLKEVLNQLDSLGRSHPGLTSAEIKELYMNPPKDVQVIVTEFWVQEMQGKPGYRMLACYKGFIPVDKETEIGSDFPVPWASRHSLERTVLDIDNGKYIVYLKAEEN